MTEEQDDAEWRDKWEARMFEALRQRRLVVPQPVRRAPNKPESKGPPLGHKEEATVLVRMSPYLVQALSDGSIGHKWVFGEPDKEGFYEPTVYITTPAPAYRRGVVKMVATVAMILAAIWLIGSAVPAGEWQVFIRMIVWAFGGAATVGVVLVWWSQ